MTTFKILTASRMDAILVICSLARSERLGTSWEKQYNPNMGFTYTQIWLKNSPLQEVEIFFGYTPPAL